MVYGTGGLEALAFVAFLVFVVAGVLWLAVTVQHADPAVTRRNAGLVALVGGAVLVAVLIAQAFAPNQGTFRYVPGFLQPPGNIVPLRPGQQGQPRQPGQPQPNPQTSASPRP